MATLINFRNINTEEDNAVAALIATKANVEAVYNIAQIEAILATKANTDFTNVGQLANNIVEQLKGEDGTNGAAGIGATYNFISANGLLQIVSS